MTTLAERQKRVGLNLSLNVAGQDAAGHHFAEATRTVNISGGGVCFESHQHLLVGSRLSLHIELPDNLRKHFGGKAVYRARAAVCRVERFEGNARCRIGARFLGEIEA
jgi:hypothetical protein